MPGKSKYQDNNISCKKTVIWKVAVYVRLSREDEEEKIESNSIGNQRELIRAFINGQTTIPILAQCLKISTSKEDTSSKLMG